MGRKIIVSNEAHVEQERAEKARILLEERLQGLPTFAIKDTSESARNDRLNTSTSSKSALSEAEIEEARREAEERREARRAEILISSKLYAKEQRARALASEAKRKARAEVRTERELQAFQDTKADLEEAERRRQVRLQARQDLKQSGANVFKTELTGAEKERARLEYARRDAERAEAARVAEIAQRALKELGISMASTGEKISGRSLIETAKSNATQPSSARKLVKVSRPVSSMTSIERRSRRMVLEALRALGDGTSFDAIRNLVARATTLGLADDCPELLEARVREHTLGLKKAKLDVDRVNDELAFAISNHKKLKEQGYHRAVDRALRRVDITRQKQTEAEGAVQYHEARGQAATLSLQREFAARTQAERPLYMLDEEKDELNQSAHPTAADEDSDDDLGPHRKDKDQKHKTKAVMNRARKKARQEAIDRSIQRRVLEENLARAAAARTKAEAEARARKALLLEARTAAAARAKQRAQEEQARDKEIARRAELRADAAAAAEAAEKAAESAAARLREAATKKNPTLLKDVDALRRAARERRADAELARQHADDLMSRQQHVTSEEKIDASKLALHFFHSEVDELNLSLQIQVPSAWYAKPAGKLLSVFVKTYNARKHPHQITPSAATLSTVAGTKLPDQLLVQEALALSRGTLRVSCP